MEPGGKTNAAAIVVQHVVAVRDRFGEQTQSQKSCSPVLRKPPVIRVSWVLESIRL